MSQTPYYVRTGGWTLLLLSLASVALGGGCIFGVSTAPGDGATDAETDSDGEVRDVSDTAGPVDAGDTSDAEDGASIGPWDCSSGQCECPDNETCPELTAERCSAELGDSASCEAVCRNNSTCELTCGDSTACELKCDSGADCTQNCNGDNSGTNCTLAKCEGSENCKQFCRRGDDCRVDCSLANSDSVDSCVQDCVDGNAGSPCGMTCTEDSASACCQKDCGAARDKCVCDSGETGMLSGACNCGAGD